MPTFTSTMAPARAPFILVPLLAALAAPSAQAADIVLGANSTAAQTVGPPPGRRSYDQRGRLADGQQAAAVAVTLNGNNATVTTRARSSRPATAARSATTPASPASSINNGSATNTPR